MRRLISFFSVFAACRWFPHQYWAPDALDPLFARRLSIQARPHVCFIPEIWLAKGIRLREKVDDIEATRNVCVYVKSGRPHA